MLQFMGSQSGTRLSDSAEPNHSQPAGSLLRPVWGLCPVFPFCRLEGNCLVLGSEV